MKTKRERGNEPNNNHKSGKITVCGHYKKWREINPGPDVQTMYMQTVRYKMRAGERRRNKTRRSQLFTTKGWTSSFLVGLVWLHLICFGQTILDPLARQLCVVDLAVNSRSPLGSVVVSAGPAQSKGPEMQRDVAQDSWNNLQRNRRGWGLWSGGSDHFNCQTALPLLRLHSGQRK